MFAVGIPEMFCLTPKTIQNVSPSLPSSPLLFPVEHRCAANLLFTEALWFWLSLCHLLFFLCTPFPSLHLPLYRHTGLTRASPSSQGCADFPGSLKSGWEKGGKNPRRLLLVSESSSGSSGNLWLLPRHLRNTFETSPACWAP